MPTHMQDRRANASASSTPQLRRRSTDVEENIKQIGAESITRFSEMAIRSLQQRNVSVPGGDAQVGAPSQQYKY